MSTEALKANFAPDDPIAERRVQLHYLSTNMANHLAFSVVLFLAIAFTRPVLSDGASTEVDVIILGAGISGITAGNHLQANGLTNFLILEAQDYIGGRIKQARIGNVTVGEGANWVHLVEEGDDNPILGLAKKINLNRYANNYTDMNLRYEIKTNFANTCSCCIS